MTVRCLVIDEQPDSYEGKKGKVDQWKVLCLDFSDGHRCKTMFEYSLPKDQEALKGRLKDQFVDLTITEITSGFGGSMRVRGSITTIASGQQPAAEPQPASKKAA